MKKRRRLQQTQPLEERLANHAKCLRAEARTLAPGRQREAMLRRARQDEVTVHLSEWLRSSGLKSPA
nr:hypothetical protein [Bradyrhizobium iriomotense]